MKKSSDRTDPRKNKSLAIRMVIDRLPNAKFAEVAEAVKAEFGHEVRTNLFYMLKAQGKMKPARKSKKVKAAGSPAVTAAASTSNTATKWVEAIKAARHLIKATGSVANAITLLNAVDGIE